MGDSISNLSDAELIDVANQTFNAISGNLADYPGVTQQMIDDLKTFTQAFEPELTLHVQKQAEARAQTQVKDAKHDPVDSQLRLVRNLYTAGGASAAAKAATGIRQALRRRHRQPRPSRRQRLTPRNV